MRLLGAKCAKNAFAAGAYSAPPDPLAGFKGTYFFKGREGQGREEKEGEGRKSKGREGKERGERGKGRERVIPVSYFFFPTSSLVRRDGKVYHVQAIFRLLDVLDIYRVAQKVRYILCRIFQRIRNIFKNP